MVGLIEVAIGLSLLLAGGSEDAKANEVITENANGSIVEERTVEENILGEYIEGVDKDTTNMINSYAGVINVFVKDVENCVGDTLKDPASAEHFDDNIEKLAEDFADTMEEIGESYGKIQKKNGDAFGERFDDDTADSVVNVVYNIFKKYI